MKRALFPESLDFAETDHNGRNNLLGQDAEFELSDVPYLFDRLQRHVGVAGDEFDTSSHEYRLRQIERSIPGSVVVSRRIANAQFSEIQDAIDYLSSGGTIVVDCVSEGTSYQHFDCMTDNITIVGVKRREYDPVSESFVGTGVLIEGASTAFCRNFRLENVSLLHDGDVLILAGSEIEISDVVAAGSAYDAPWHTFGALQRDDLGFEQYGVRFTRCKAYKNVHGFAVRHSGVTLTDCEAEDNGFDGLILKAGDGEQNQDLIVNGFRARSRHNSTLIGVFVQVTGDDGGTPSRLKNVNINNVVVSEFSGTLSAGVKIFNDTGSIDACQQLNLSNLTIDSAYGQGVYVEGATNIQIVNAHAHHGTFYGFHLKNSTYISLLNCSASYNGGYGFVSEGCSNVYLRQAISRFNAADVAGTWDVTEINGVTSHPLQLTTGDVVVGGILNVGGIAYLQSHLYMLNKLATSWVQILERDTSGSDTVANLKNIGTIIVNGLATLNSDLNVAGLATLGAIYSSSYLTVATDLDVGGSGHFRNHVNLLNKAANGFLRIIERDTSGSEVVANLKYIGKVEIGGNQVLGPRGLALTDADGSTPNCGDPTTDALIENIRTRLNEIQSRIQAHGLIS